MTVHTCFVRMVTWPDVANPNSGIVSLLQKQIEVSGMLEAVITLNLQQLPTHTSLGTYRLVRADRLIAEQEKEQHQTAHGMLGWWTVMMNSQCFQFEGDADNVTPSFSRPETQ